MGKVFIFQKIIYSVMPKLSMDEGFTAKKMGELFLSNEVGHVKDVAKADEWMDYCIESGGSPQFRTHYGKQTIKQIMEDLGADVEGQALWGICYGGPKDQKDIVVEDVPEKVFKELRTGVHSSSYVRSVAKRAEKE